MLLNLIKLPFIRPLSKLRQLLPELKSLKRDLESIDKNDREPIKILVNLFNTIAPWHDQKPFEQITICLKKFSNRYSKLLANINELEAHIINAGRDEYGLNRTVPGQTVTLDNVYLGNIYGLWTKTAQY
jgi:hypothetical protein